MHAPQEQHLNALKRILRYVKGTLDLGLHLYPSAPTGLITYTDTDWGGCLGYEGSINNSQWRKTISCDQ